MATAAPLSGGQGGVAGLQAARSVAITALRADAPDLADALAVSTHSLTAVQAALGPGETLAYALPARDADTLQLLLVTGSGVRLVSAGITAADLRAQLQRLADAVEQRDAARQVALADELATGLRLDQWGVARSLYVVSSGDMHFIPWGTMPTAGPVVVVPLGGWRLRSPPVGPPHQTAVVLGDPDLGPGAAPLPGARAEAEVVARRFGAAALLGRDATEANLRQAVGPGTGVLHLATHGVFDADNPLQSAIYLAGDDRPRKLTAGDLVAAPLAARLLVLSACEPGLGAVTAGDDYLGLARSLYLGGTQAILHGLWPVEDEGTQRFMAAFHGALADGNAADAWLAARNATKAMGLPPSVYGAFVLGGSATVTLR